MTTFDTPVLVVDMSTLRFVSSNPRAPLRLMTRSGHVLAVVHPRVSEDRHDLAFRALDAALLTGSFLEVDPHSPSARRSLRVAFYNPATADIAFGSNPDTVTFSAAAPLTLHADGTRATVHTADDGTLTLTLGELDLPSITRSASELTRVLADNS